MKYINHLSFNSNENTIAQKLTSIIILKAFIHELISNLPLHLFRKHTHNLKLNILHLPLTILSLTLFQPTTTSF